MAKYELGDKCSIGFDETIGDLKSMAGDVGTGLALFGAMCVAAWSIVTGQAKGKGISAALFIGAAVNEARSALKDTIEDHLSDDEAKIKLLVHLEYQEVEVRHGGQIYTMNNWVAVDYDCSFSF